MTIASTGRPTPAPTRDHDCGCDGGPCDPPRPLERNAFFPRKLMEVRHWRAEQRYHRSAREVVTRLATGAGVLCGLEVVLTDTGTVVVEAGIAVDGRGRIIVVPEDVEIDPGRTTDACGRPSGATLEKGVLTVSLCYRECGTDLVAIPSDSCDGDAECVAGMIREAFAIAVTPGAKVRAGLPDGVCEALRTGRTDATPEGEKEDRRLLLDRLAPRDCSCAEDCVPLATVTIDSAVGRSLDANVRTVIRSNRELLDLILCLADRLDHCCGGTAVARAPRITAMWPWPDPAGTAVDEFVKERVVELAFDRDLGELGLTDPDSWLGLWVLTSNGVMRLGLQRSGTPTHVAAPVGGDAASYQVIVPAQTISTTHARRGPAASREAIVLIMVRSTIAGVIRAEASDHLALDADAPATTLDATQRDALWGIAPGGSDLTLGALAAAAVPRPGIALPSGDGAAGGELHIVLRRPGQTADPPRLLAVRPGGAVELSADHPDLGDEWKKFIEFPYIEIDVSAPLAAAAVGDPGAWLRVWHGTPDGDFLYGVREIKLAPGGGRQERGGRWIYAFPMADYQPFGGYEQVLVQLRSSHALSGASAPVGEQEPLLLDADFLGTAVADVLWPLWEGSHPTTDIPVLGAIPTAGETLFDGSEGGFAHWGFTVITN